MNSIYSSINKISTTSCNLCARRCNIDRTKQLGFCRIDDNLYVSTICLHYGEEPVISGKDGICNVFFNHCNLQCEYCQNYQISNNKSSLNSAKISLQQCYEQIISFLDNGCNMLGLVSPTPYSYYIYALADMLAKNNYHPTIVYNTNSYDTVETIRSMKDIVDVYLPDYKYGSYELAKILSKAEDYPDAALQSIKEMVKQKGTKLILDENGMAKSGVIIRHLILPGHLENSKSALLNIANEISTNLYISLMLQYYPVYHAKLYPDLDRKVTMDEYKEVSDFMFSLGFDNGWTQEPESSECYKPDFEQNDVFKR